LDESISGELQVVRSADACELSCPGVRLSFLHGEGRWLHVVEARSDSGSWATLREESATASPAFQDLHMETLGPGCVEVQAMGQASRNIFSCAVRFDANLRSIDFDFAARLRVVSSESVATAWRMACSPVATVECSPHQLVIGPASEPLLTMTCDQPGVALTMRDREAGGGFRLIAGYCNWSELSPGRTGVTVRWHQRIQFGV
jgi:hypothetical protein